MFRKIQVEDVIRALAKSLTGSQCERCLLAGIQKVVDDILHGENIECATVTFMQHGFWIRGVRVVYDGVPYPEVEIHLHTAEFDSQPTISLAITYQGTALRVLSVGYNPAAVLKCRVPGVLLFDYILQIQEAEDIRHRDVVYLMPTGEVEWSKDLTPDVVYSL